MSVNVIFEPLTLPNGSVAQNRLCKAAMEENLAVQPGQIPGEKLFALYEAWAKGGVGMILSGNVMVDPSALTGPGAVVLEQGSDLTPFRKWAELGKAGGAQFWLQISHPGRQLYKAQGEQAVSPSGIALDLGKLSSLFAPVRALEGAEIEALVTRFADTAQLAEEAGFDGVQIHGAHGYLISQFLSPLANRREDEWGGSLENRARFLLAIVDAARARVGKEFGIGLKLNSADFQRGGFAFEDARQVVQWLNGRGVDFVELSGGSYESPAMMGDEADSDARAQAPSEGPAPEKSPTEQSTTEHPTSEQSPSEQSSSEQSSSGQSSSEQREAYFVDFARDIAKVADMPIMVTGGITRRDTAVDALAQDVAGFGVAMLGIARAMAFNPDLPNDWRAGRDLTFTMPEPNWSNKTLKGLANMAVTKAQLERMAVGQPIKPRISPIAAMIGDQWRTARRSKKYRNWRRKKG